MIVDVLLGPPGCGKSTAMRDAAIQNPGLYLFALPTTALIKEQAAAFQAEAPTLDVTQAHSDSAGKGTVQAKLDAAIERIADGAIKHAVILITHEGLMGSDLGAMAGWHARIDEAPNAVQSRTTRVPASLSLLKEAVALDPVGQSGWSEVSLIMDAPGWRDLAGDELLKPLAELFKLTQRHHGVFVNRTEWKKDFGWCSVWLPTALSHFASCQFAGASYPTSLGAVVAKKLLGDELTFRTEILPASRTAHPTIRVHYFTQSHEGTSKLWSTSLGRGFIVPVCDFLGQIEPPVGFWSGNGEVAVLMDHRVPGGPIKPKVAGLNEWRDETSCAFIYSSKPMPGDEPLKELFGLSDDEIRRSREDEDVIQFVMRGAIRNADFGGNYDIYLYSRRQAETLVAQLTNSGVGQSVTLVPELDPGIMDKAISSIGAISTALKAEKAADRKRRNAESAKRARMKRALAAGRSAGRPGRPPKKGP